VRDSNCSDDDILWSLLGASEYDTSYLGPGLNAGVFADAPGTHVHGPYLLALLEPKMYIRRSVAEALRDVDQFLSSARRTVTVDELGLRKLLIDPILLADVIFRLPGSYEAAWHGDAWILGDFSELVMVNRTDLTLVVATMGFQ